MEPIIQKLEENDDERMDKLFQSLRADCENCFGLCCVSLYFLKTEGFPINKEPGIPCPNLLSNFKCAIHEDLRKKGLKGCASFDCFGAGAKIAQQTFKGADWMSHPENTNKIFDTFQVMRQLHEILWYLNQAAVKMNMADRKSLFPMIDKIEKLTKLEADKLLVLDVSACRADANIFLLKVKNDMKSHLLKNEKDETGKRKIKHQLDWMGKDLRKMDLRGADFRGAYLMAANLSGTNLKGADFIGADLRDTDLCGADLSECLFLTQAQVNVAKGNKTTKLPYILDYPEHWK